MGFLSAIRSLFRGRPARPVHATYDATRSDSHNAQHWANSDALDADSANSIAIRQKLSQRARYEEGNNGHGKGIILTHANYVIGRGPTLRVRGDDARLAADIETRWKAWWRKVKGAQKLRTAWKAKTRDGESFLIAKWNPRLADDVTIDLVGIECEQCQSPYLALGQPNRVDGIVFDEFGNPLYYEILRYHPGGTWFSVNQDPERIPAEYVFHLQREDRFGQKRAVSELTPSLNVFAQGRRWREATLAAAENIANLSVLAKTQGVPNQEYDEVRPFSSFPMEKGMMGFLPDGYDVFQPKPEQPTATYDMVDRAQSREEARPLNMPANIAMCDSSGYSFSGGRLDHLTYFVSVDVERDDCELLFLDPLFSLWYSLARLVYGWVPEAPPAHEWGWPGQPDIDREKTANSRKTNLATGVQSLSDVYAEDGYDFEDKLPKLAADYGKTVDEMREALFQKHFVAPSQANTPVPDESPPARNGNGRMTALPQRNGSGR